MESRKDSRKLFKDVKWKPLNNIQLFLLSFFVALSTSLFLKEDGMTEAMQNTIFILVFAIGLWLTEAIPPYVVGIMTIISLVWLLGGDMFVDEPRETAQYTQTWASPIIFLMLGGFYLAEGLKQTKLDSQLFKLSIGLFGKSPSMVLLGLMITTGILSMIMSNTATTAMMIAAVIPFLKGLDEKEPLRKSLLLGIPTAASVGGMGTIIGTPPNAIAVQFLESKGMGIDFVKWMLYGFPLAVCLIFFFWFILKSLFKTDLKEVVLSVEEGDFEISKKQKQSKIVMIGTLLLTVLMWLTSPIHGIGAASVASIPILALSVGGIIGAKEFRQLPWETLALVAGGLSLGAAIMDTGLANFYLDRITIDPNQYQLLFFVVFAVLTVILSNIMSNTATSSILIPLACALFPEKALETSLIVGLSASCALLLPVSTPPNAIAYSSGMLQQKDFRLGGFVIGVAGPILIILWVLLVV